MKFVNWNLQQKVLRNPKLERKVIKYTSPALLNKKKVIKSGPSNPKRGHQIQKDITKSVPLNPKRGHCYQIMNVGKKWTNSQMELFTQMFWNFFQAIERCWIHRNKSYRKGVRNLEQKIFLVIVLFKKQSKR